MDDYQTQLKTECTSIGSLSDDILADIFTECIEPKCIFNYEKMAAARPHWGDPFEIVVSHVSRRWRYVAINLAALWSNIYIVPFQSLKLLEIYLARSQQRLLDIAFSLDGYGPATDQDDSSLTLSLTRLISHVERWRLISIHSCSYRTIEEIVTAVRELSAPELVHFNISLWVNEHQSNLSSPELAFEGSIFMGGAPCLSYFQCIAISIGSCWPPLPLHALTHLRLDTCSFDDISHSAIPLTRNQFQQLLTSVPALTNLRLRGLIFEPEEGAEPWAIVLSQLVSLDFDFDQNDQYTRNVMSAISSPALTSIAFGNMPVEVVNAFVEATNISQYWPKYPTLTHLQFSDVYLPHRIHLNSYFVDALPTITHISFRSCTFDVLAALAKADSRAEGIVPWPNLRTVTINPFTDKWVQPLCDFIAARIGSGHPLESIRLSQSDIMTLSGAEFFRSNVRLDLDKYDGFVTHYTVTETVMVAASDGEGDDEGDDDGGGDD